MKISLPLLTERLSLKNLFKSALLCAVLFYNERPFSGFASPLTPDPQGLHLHDIENLHFQAEWHDDPVTATLEGVHQGDALLPDLSDIAHAHHWARLADEETALKRLDLSDASQIDQDDRDILLAELKGKKLTAAVIRPDIHQPDYALTEINNALYGLIIRNYEPIQIRLKKAIERLRAIPAFLTESQKRLQDVPPIYRDIALQNITSTKAFFQFNLPHAFLFVKSPSLLKEFDAANQDALTAIDKYARALKEMKAQGDFALGRPAIVQLLASDMIDISPEKIISLGQIQLDKDRAAFLALEKQINPEHPEEAIETIRKEHPTEENLLQIEQQNIWDARNFLVTHRLVTIPGLSLPKPRFTPSFEQNFVSAGIEWAGPFEAQKLPIFFNITPPSPTDTKEEYEEALEDLNNGYLQNLALHEAMPGHYMQILYLQSHPYWSYIRRAAHSQTTTEGWAHYAEYMMIEEGYAQNNPSLQLVQRQEAVLRDCRLLVSFGLHIHKMSLQQAEDFMQNRCFQSPLSAHNEAIRGALNPSYFSYSLGKMMILKLRDDAQKQQGKAFSLQKFHTDFLNKGLVPMEIIRKEMHIKGSIL